MTLLNRVNQWLHYTFKATSSSAVPAIIKRSKHTISRSMISQRALKVLYRLKDAGFSAYLVGGGVRDILLNRQPKDFDVVTNAHPEQVRHLFRNSRIIGRRFRLVHVFFHDEIIEVSTFRANIPEDTKTQVNPETGMIHRDNTYGTIEEDAWRRDFTINALYYNIADFSVVDYMRGMEDLKHRRIRVIGDPMQRYHEDPVRMLRAIRLAAKLNFQIEEQSEQALRSLTHLLRHVPSSRLFDELLKLFFEGSAAVVYQALLHYDYINILFPQTMAVLKTHSSLPYHKRLIQLAMAATDERLLSGQSVNPGFLLAVLLWPVLQVELKQVKHQKMKFHTQVYLCIASIIRSQAEIVMIPKRLQVIIRSIWLLQFHLEKCRAKRIYYVFNHRYFRAAFDFLSLRAQSGEALHPSLQWWTAFQSSTLDQQKIMIQELRS